MRELALVVIATAFSIVDAGAQQRSLATLCGRIVLVGCSGPSSDVTMRLVPGTGGAGWQLVVPRARRPLFGARIEEQFEQQLACATLPRRDTSASGFAIDDPGQLRVVDRIQLPASAPDVAWSCDADVTMPRLVHDVRPQYTPTALQQKVEGGIILRGVVGLTGSVSDIRIVQRLEPTLDNEAVRAFSQWRFQPGTRSGEPAPVSLSVEMTFTTR